MSRPLLLLLSLVLSLSLLSSPVLSQQDSACFESALDLYAVYGRQNVTLNPFSLLLNITTQLNTNTYSATLPQSYPLGYLWLELILPVNASFNVIVNNITLAAPNGLTTFNYTAGGTFVEAAPIYSLGALTTINTIVINIFNRNAAGVLCTYTDTFLITNPGPATAITGDPMFLGLRGQQYQVHGIDGAVYNLISDPYTQVNSRFAFLTGPRPCAVLPSTGRRSTTCWTHPGSYLGELGIKTSGNDRLFIQAGSATEGFHAVTLNGRRLKVGSELELHYPGGSGLSSGSFHYNNSQEVQVTVGYFTLTIENSDAFLNIRSIKVDNEHWNRLQSHGLLGQTWRNQRYGGRVQEIEGEVDDYVVGDDIFGDNFLFNKFEQ